MPAYRHIAIIYNPISTGPSRIAASWLKRGLTRRLPGTAVSLLKTEHAGHAEELAYAFARKHPDSLVVSSSGDGGYNEVINGVMRANADGSRALAAVLPAGNANDHRQALRKGPLLAAIVSGNATDIDLLHVKIRSAGGESYERYAHSYAGFGLTPTVASELNRHSLNRLKESWIVIKALYHFKPFEASVEGKVQRFDSIICANIGRMAKLLTVAKGADSQDGKFEVVRFPARSRPQLLLTLLKAATVGLPVTQPVTTFKLGAVHAMPLQIDGEVKELAAGDTVTITSAPGALGTIV